MEAVPREHIESLLQAYGYAAEGLAAKSAEQLWKLAEEAVEDDCGEDMEKWKLLSLHWAAERGYEYG